MYLWCVFALYVLATYGSLAKAFMCVVNPISAVKEYGSHRTHRQQRLKCPALRMALGRGVDPKGEQQPIQQVAAAGGLATTASLERVMDGLGESEKYNAVLQGLSNILMGKKKGGAAATGAFEEVYHLLDEMHANRIKCTIRTASAVVDAATATTNIGIITEGTARSNSKMVKSWFKKVVAAVAGMLAVGITPNNCAAAECSIEGKEFTACFRDSRDDRIMVNTFKNRNMTHFKCKKHCLQFVRNDQTVVTYGMQNGIECWCDNISAPEDLSQHGLATGDCTKKCPGNKWNQNCGGNFAMAVFRDCI